ncbi:MAG TPA: PIN domain-containing protein [Arachnia sp.]|nr:PIN domain-containing protein [Arachnia sp.]HMT87143.1 PIN domain-containing protein [Arachnia sp.]
MIALDAGVLIAVLDASDIHHDAAVALLTEHADEELVIGPINLAEILVPAAQHGSEAELLADIEALGVSAVPLPDDAALRLARLRASSGVKMPDCCVLLTAEQTGSQVASFDERLRAAAARRGIALV